MRGDRPGGRRQPIRRFEDAFGTRSPLRVADVDLSLSKPAVASGSGAAAVRAACRVAVVGGGPAGLMAAEVLAGGGVAVDLFDAMPSVGRKFLLAGKGGLNLTHAEPADAFAGRYGRGRPHIEPLLHRFGPAALRDWAAGLGVATFVGSSGRVFPVDLKAAPLLRAWLQRLRRLGVRFHMRHRWVGFGSMTTGAAPRLRFEAPAGVCTWQADAVVLALGGASWPQLGSDGRWWPLLQAHGVTLTPLEPANCGFDAARPGPDGALLPGWSALLRERHAGAPLKNVALSWPGPDGAVRRQVGECVVTAGGVEGSLVYAASASLRDAIAAHGHVLAQLDLLPARSAAWVDAEVARPRGARSLATHLKSRLGLDGIKAALLHELLPATQRADPAALAAAIKALPLPMIAARPIAEAISTAGGVRFDAFDADVDGDAMLHALPGVTCAGEMLDWEAPTGGYLLTACMASGVAAADAVLQRLGADG